MTIEKTELIDVVRISEMFDFTAWGANHAAELGMMPESFVSRLVRPRNQLEILTVLSFQDGFRMSKTIKSVMPAIDIMETAFDRAIKRIENLEPLFWLNRICFEDSRGVLEFYKYRNGQWELNK